MPVTRAQLLAAAALISPAAPLHAVSVALSPNQNNPTAYDTTGNDLTLSMPFNSDQFATQSGQIYGTGSLAKTGMGTIRLTAKNSYTGGTLILSGGLSLENPVNDSVGTIQGNVRVVYGGHLQTTTINALGYATGQKVDRIELDGGTFYNTGTGDQGWGVNYVLRNAAVMSSGNAHLNPAANSPTSSSYFTLGGPAGGNASVVVEGGQPGHIALILGRVDLRSDNGNPAVPIRIGVSDLPVAAPCRLDVIASVTGNAGIVKDGPGILNLSAINTYTGTTTVNGGTLNINTSNGATGGIRSPLVINGGTVNLNADNALGYRDNEKVNAITIHNGLLSANGNADQGWGVAYTLNGGEMRTNGGNPDPATLNKFAFGNFTTVTVGASGSPMISGRVDLRTDLNPNTDITVGANGNLQVEAVVTGGGGIRKLGPGKMTLAAANTFTGGLNVVEGTVAANGNSLPGSVANNGEVVFLSSGTCAGIISGSGKLQKAVAGTLVLSGANTYAGGTTLAGGFFSIGSNGNLGAANSALTFSGGGLITTADLTLSRPITATTGVVLSPDAGTTLTLNSVVSGTVGLNKGGAGVLKIDSINTHSGGTYINEGRLLLANASGGTGVIRGGLTATSGSIIEVSNSGALGQTAGQKVDGITLTGGATLLNSSGTGIGAEQSFTLTNGTLVSNGGTASATAASRFICGGGSFTVNGASQTSTISGRLDLQAGTNFNVSHPTATLNVTAAVTGDDSTGLSKSGSGKMILSGPNPYGGPTSVVGGTLQVNNPQAVSYSVTNGSLHFRGTSLAGRAGGGAQTFGANNFGFIEFFDTASAGAGSYTAGLDCGINFSNSSTAGSGTYSIGNGSNLTLFDSANAGTATITTLAGGKFEFVTGTSASGARVIAQAGSFVGSLAGTGTFGIGSLSGAATLKTGTAKISLGALGMDDVFSGVIQESGSLVKTGTGTLTLSAINTYAGGTTIDGGLIEFSTPANLGTGNIVLNGGGLRWAAGNTTDLSTRFGAFGSGGATIDTNGNGITLASVLSGSGGLTKTGTGALTLPANNTYSGGTTIKGGTIPFSSLANFGSGNIVLDGGGLRWMAANTVDVSPRLGTIGSGGASLDTNGNDITLASGFGGSGLITKSGAGNLTLTGSNSYSGGITMLEGNLTGHSSSLLGNIQLPTTLTFQQNFDGTFNGSIGGTGSLVKTGTGRLVLAGSNSYTGGTTIGGGTLELGVAGCLGTGNLTFAGGGLRWSAGNTEDLSGRFNPFPASVTQFDTNGNDITLASDFSGLGFEKKGAGKLTLAGNVSANVHMKAGALAIPTGGQLQSDQIELDASTARIEGGDVTARLAYFGSGSPGSCTLESGHLEVTEKFHLGFFASGGELTVEGGSVTSKDTLVGSRGTGVLNLSGGTFQSTADLIVGNEISTGTINMTGGTLQAASTTVGDMGQGSHGTLNLSGGTWTSSGPMSARFATINLTDTATLDLGNNTLQLVYEEAVLNLGSGGSAGTLMAGGISGANAQTSAVNFNHSGTCTLAAPVTGNLKVTKLGGGTTRLTGASTYSGQTSVQAGTLLVDGSLGTSSFASPSPVSVISGATLGGSGSIDGGTTVAAGAHLAPGGGEAGTLSFHSDLGFEAGSVIDMQVGTARDLIRVTGGTVTGPASGSITVNLTATPGFTMGSFTILDATGATLSNLSAASFTLGNSIPGYTYAFIQTGNVIKLTAISNDPYGEWSSNIPDPDQRGRESDPDDDGFSNLEEFLFGTSPLLADGSLVANEKVAGGLLLRWLQRSEGASYLLQESAGLADDWLTSTLPVVDGDQGAVPSGYTRKEATVPFAGEQSFLRIKGEEEE